MQDPLTDTEVSRKLNSFTPRPYQLPMLKALDDGYKRVLAVLPRRAGKDITALNYVIRRMWDAPGVYYYIFPTYSQAKKVIWDSITNDGKKIMDYFPEDLLISMNAQEMKVRMRAKDGKESLFQLIGSDNYDCFDDQTEILTKRGWILFKDLEDHDEYATMRPQSHEFEWQKAEKRVQYFHDGEMISVENKSLNFVVTPNHRVYCRSSKGNYSFKRADDPHLKNWMIPNDCRWEGESPSLINGYNSFDFVRFLGFFLSEGSLYKSKKCYRITISQIKPHVREEIKNILKNMGLNYVEHKEGFNIEDKDLYVYLSEQKGQKNRFIPREILELSSLHLQELFHCMVKGDGSVTSAGTFYFSISKKLIDGVQELLVKLGYGANITEKPQSDSVIQGRTIRSKNVLYQIRVRTSEFKRLCGPRQKSYINKIHYTGNVYCVSVRNKIVKVRRKGKEVWSGNSLMGTNPRGCVFSEYALQDPMAYQFIRPILTANGGWALFISTPRGKNHLWQLAELAQNSPDWFYIRLSVEDTAHIPLSEIERERREGLMSEDMIQQEYYCSFNQGVEGAYYSRYLDTMKREHRLSDVPWENGFKVHTAWDLGIRDQTSIIFFQTIGQTVRIIDCYENSKHGLEHYVNILQGKPYTYGVHIAPHDIRVREWTSGYSRLDKARELGVHFTVADGLEITDGIEAVRSLFSKLWIDETKCASLVKALENYRQEWDNKRKVYKPRPLHDWSSHLCDSMRYLAISIPKTKDGLSADDIEKAYQQAVYGEDTSLPSVFQQPRY